MYQSFVNVTVESVTAGHPDKVCDQIADAILDACLKCDPRSRVAVEVLGSHGLLVIGGEVTTRAKINYEAIARRVYRDIGYRDPLKITVRVAHQSSEIAAGVDTGGAGDQGIQYGFATNETPEFLPRPIVEIQKLAARLEYLRRRDRRFKWLRPDGKVQLTYEKGKVQSIVVSCQHDAYMALDDMRPLLGKHLIVPVLGRAACVAQIMINPAGLFTTGGFAADAGLTGRKIIADTYCGLAPHGGGSFSGKDPTKVDRSGAYMARFAAKNIVAQGRARECLVSVAYVIGQIEPAMLVATNEFGKDISKYLYKYFDFRPQAIIERLNLRRPIYRPTAAYGHFGRAEFPWEEIVEFKQ